MLHFKKNVVLISGSRLESKAKMGTFLCIQLQRSLEAICSLLLPFHALLGCDSLISFWGKWRKKSFLDTNKTHIQVYRSVRIMRVIAFEWQSSWLLHRIYLQVVSTKNSKWVWYGNTTITNCRQPRGTARKSRSTITRHQKDKLSKATSSVFLIKMIAILEWT